MPLPGIGSGRMTSKAEMRSVATNQQALRVDAIDVADLAACDELQTAQIRFEQSFGGRRHLVAPQTKASDNEPTRCVSATCDARAACRARIERATMQWFGKAIGAIVGFAAGGPIGSVLGALLGHQCRRKRRARRQRARALRADQPAVFRGGVRGHGARREGRRPRVGGRGAHGARASCTACASRVRRCADAIDCFTRGKSSSYALRSGSRA